MNRFNLFFIFIATLISSALHYTVQEEENLKQEIKSLLYITEPSRADLTSKKSAPDTKNENGSTECEVLPGVIIHL